MAPLRHWRTLPAFILLATSIWAQRTVSPAIAPDRQVTFTLQALAATEVSLTGEFMKGSKPLQKNGQGLWTLTVGPIEPEIYYYNFTIDGVRTIDPVNPNAKTGPVPSRA